MADDGRAGSVDLSVQHGQKVGRQCPVSIFHREIFLVVTHDGDQNLLRQRQVFRLKVAGQYVRPFGKVGHLFDQIFVFAPAGTGQGAGDRIEGLANALSSRRDIHHDERFCKRRLVRGRAHNDHGRIPMQNAVPVADVGGANAGKLNRDHGLIQQAEQPLHGTHEALRFTRPPVHRLRPCETADFLRQ